MLRLQDFMSTKVLTVDAGIEADSAWDQMRFNRVHHLVVYEKSQLVGIISEQDLGGPKMENRTGKTVRDLMTRQVVSASPRSTVREAANLLRGHAIGCLPVLDEGKLVGIVTISDLLELLGKGTQRPVQKNERPVWNREPQRKRGHALR